MSVSVLFAYCVICFSFYQIFSLCLTAGLVSISGMEKKLLIKHNTIERNVGTFMIEFKIDSQSEIMGQLPANFIFNVIRLNSPPTADVSSLFIFSLCITLFFNSKNETCRIFKFLKI